MKNFHSLIELIMRPRVLLVGALYLFGSSLICESLTAKITPRAKEKTITNGAQLILIEHDELPILVFRIVIAAGSKYDPPGKSGLASVTAELLRYGAGQRVGPELLRYTDSLGIELTVDVNRDVAQITATTNRREMLSTIKLIKEMLSEPNFDEIAFERQVKAQSSAALQAYDVGFPVMGELAFNEFYGSEGLGSFTSGAPQTLAQLTLADVRQFFHDYFSPERIEIIVSGDFASKRLRNELIEAFYPVSKRADPISVTVSASPAQTDSVRFLLLDSPGANGVSVGIYAPGKGVSSGSNYAGELVVTHLLAGYPELSFLGRKLTEDEALISNLSSSIPFSAGPSMMSVTMQCSAEDVVDVVSEALSTMDLLRESRISKRELEEAKQFFRGYYALSFETASDIALRMSECMIAGLRYNHYDELLASIETLTQADLKSTSHEMLAPGNIVVVVVGDSRRYVRQLEDYGRVKQVKSPSSIE